MKKNVLLAFATVLFAVQQISAIPAYPHSSNYTLPDGSEITLQQRGDEWVNWVVSVDGFTLLRSSDGFWEYAIQDQAGNLKLSGVRAHNESKRTIDERNFLRNVPKDLRYSASQIEAIIEVRGIRNEFLQANGDDAQRLSGTMRIPVILVGFQDRAFTIAKEAFELLLNQPNYTASGTIPGSLHDYFRDVSYNQLNLQVDVFGPFILPLNTINYAFSGDCPGGGGNPGPQTMARRAVDSAHANGANFSNYVVGGSTTVRTVHIIFAGFGRESGAGTCPSIWSHASSFNPVTYNGVTLSRYSCSPELRAGTNSITTIGVIAHELGHSIFNWPDFYDTDYGGSGGQAVDLGPWCLMAGGAHGSTPSRPSAWCVVDAGWVPEVVLETPLQDITLPNPMEAGIAYRINTVNTNEYFLLENRQQIGWDAVYVPGSATNSGGMLIYHIDRVTGLAGGNCYNCNPNRRRNYIKQAGCTVPLGCTTSRHLDPWPQPQLGQTEFTDQSIPGSLAWTSNNVHTLTKPTEKPITDIEHDRALRTVSFRFMPNPRAEGAVVDTPTLESKTFNSITVHTLTPPSNGQAVQYAISTSNSATPLSLPWQFSTTFSGLWPLEFYYIYARSAANDEFYAGIPSISEAIQTSPHVSIRDVEIHGRESLQAWVQNGVLHIKGLNVGQIYRIYNISGVMVHQGIAKFDVETQCITSLPRGTYIIQSENKSVKITL
ncbi:MAG: M6 family metalloprotease domain-containing protein [Bacteroidales bacterium]|nr:M6 family metalloprotease domain-containing protein [Bacteroidales bacterium]